jgi:predicted acetyltransferase
MVYKRNDKIVSSCKLFDLTVSSRGRTYSMLGVGAVYTMKDLRGQGYASDLITEVIDLAEDEGYNCVTLYSEIGVDFYEQFGFRELGSAEFSIEIHNQDYREDDLDKTVFAGPSDALWLEEHYSRWLRTQPYGVIRSQAYWGYKLDSERFLESNSSLSWPELELIAVRGDTKDCGYVIMEQGGSTIRILELIGSEKSRMQLWKTVLACAAKRGAKRIRGWEGVVRDLAPGFSLKPILPNDLPADLFGSVQYCDRDWGVAMMLPLSDELTEWGSQFPCPLLELDHF